MDIYFHNAHRTGPKQSAQCLRLERYKTPLCRCICFSILGIIESRGVSNMGYDAFLDCGFRKGISGGFFEFFQSINWGDENIFYSPFIQIYQLGQLEFWRFCLPQSNPPDIFSLQLLLQIPGRQTFWCCGILIDIKDDVTKVNDEISSTQMQIPPFLCHGTCPRIMCHSFSLLTKFLYVAVSLVGIIPKFVLLMTRKAE